MSEYFTYIVILNWNGWQDTIACLESVLRIECSNYRVVVCDNGSTDDSLTNIEKWANGRINVEIPSHQKLRTLTHPVCEKPLELQKIDVEQEGLSPKQQAHKKIVLIDNRDNLGFAAGNNVGIRYAMAQPDMTHVWLLNNDTLVESDCLYHMHKRLNETEDPAICGSRIMFYDDPDIVQALGGNQFNRWTGVASTSLGRYKRHTDAVDWPSIEARLDYLCGASILLPRDYLSTVGLMEESYFLYYEEIDWATRAKDNYRQCVAADAVLYHKEGSSIGSASLATAPSVLSEYYKFRNKLKFTWRHHPFAILTCYLTSWLQVLNRLRQGRLENAMVIARILLGFASDPAASREKHIST